MIGEKRYKNEFTKNGEKHTVEVSVTVGLLPTLSVIGMVVVIWALFFR